MAARASMAMANVALPEPEEAFESRTAAIFGVGLNIVSGVCVVLLNKYIYQADGFTFMITLSALHFLFTWALTRALAACHYFEPKAPQGGFMKLLPVALGSLASVCFMNLNLAHNSVLFYQVIKLACVPVSALVQRSLYNTPLPRENRIASVIILVGAVLTALTDAHMNAMGTLYGLAAIASTVGAGILTNKRQKDLGLDHMQLLHHASPVIAVGFCLLAPVFDNMSHLASFASGDTL
eukprot:g2712.t1